MFIIVIVKTQDHHHGRFKRNPFIINEHHSMYASVFLHKEKNREIFLLLEMIVNKMVEKMVMLMMLINNIFNDK